MDLNIAKFAANQPLSIDPKPRKRPREMFPRRRWDTIKQERGPLIDAVAALRHSSYHRFEAHNKQLQHFLDRDRFQRNEGWRAEYDRLQSMNANQMTEDVARRLAELRDAIVVKPKPKVIY